jgi:hypothetical protein
MSEERIKNDRENESTASQEHLILQVEARLKVEQIALQISEAEDLGNPISREDNPNGQAVALSSASKRLSLLQKKFKIRLSRPWRDFKAISLVERQSQDVISVLSVTVRLNLMGKN